MLRVATYNLYLGADLAMLFDAADADELGKRIAAVREQLDSTRFAERAAAVAAVLAREQPDLVGLQEVCRWNVQPVLPGGVLGDETVLVDFLPTLLAALEDAGCGYDAHVVNPNFAGAMPVSDEEWVGLAGANATLVRRSGRIEVVEEASAPFGTGHEVVTPVEGVSFPIVRSWGRLDLRVDGRDVRFVNTHTEAYDAATRDAQRDELFAVNGAVDGPVVVLGDFNATPDEVGVPTPWVDAWTAGEGDGFTCGQAADLTNAESTLDQRIDYVWVRDAQVRSAWTAGDRPRDRSVPNGLWPSDHACVLADVDLG